MGAAAGGHGAAACQAGSLILEGRAIVTGRGRADAAARRQRNIARFAFIPLQNTAVLL
jgi:hypothetical protein